MQHGGRTHTRAYARATNAGGHTHAGITRDLAALVHPHAHTQRAPACAHASAQSTTAQAHTHRQRPHRNAHSHTGPHRAAPRQQRCRSHPQCSHYQAACAQPAYGKRCGINKESGTCGHG